MVKCFLVCIPSNVFFLSFTHGHGRGRRLIACFMETACVVSFRACAHIGKLRCEVSLGANTQQTHVVKGGRIALQYKTQDVEGKEARFMDIYPNMLQPHQKFIAVHSYTGTYGIWFTLLETIQHIAQCTVNVVFIASKSTQTNATNCVCHIRCVLRFPVVIITTLQQLLAFTDLYRLFKAGCPFLAFETPKQPI